MEYQMRLAERKRRFGRVLSTLSENGNGHDTTMPAPFGWEYTRNYQPVMALSQEYKPLPCEKKVPPSMLRSFEY